MEPKPCSNCGAPKHPLKVCPRCGLSNLRQETKERFTTALAEDGKEPVAAKYTAGFLGNKRVKQKHRYNVWDVDSVIEPYQGPFSEDLPAFDNPLFSPTFSTVPQEWPASPADHLSPFTATQFRPAIRYQKAALWLVEKPAAQLPMKKIWEVQVFDGWPYPATMNFARELLQSNPAASLRDVQLEILENVTKATLPHPHLWWIRVGISRSKQLFKDSQGRLYISIDRVWRLAYSLRHLGGLVGARDFLNTGEARVPHQGYFVCWETEGEARRLD